MPNRPKKPRILDFVITYLEMTERPKLSVIMPSGRKLALLRAEEPTLSFYRYLYNTVGEPWLWWERRALADDALRAIIEDEKVEVYVLYANGVPAGFAELDRRRSRDIDLAFFGLVPEFIGQGLGQYFLNIIIETAWTFKPRRLTVNTCNYDHPKAIQTYQRAGFAPYDQRHRAVKDPRDIGLISPDVKHPND